LAGSASGTLLIMAGVLCCATYTVVSRRLIFRVDPLYAVTLQETVALVWAMAIWPVGNRSGVMAALIALTPRTIVGGVLAGLMYYAAASWFYLRALKSVPATTASIFLNLQPVFGITIAYAFLGERLTESQWIGAVTIIMSVLALLIWSGSAEKRAPAAQT
jgi:drug/metabolite transporter (DMT)-like permease